MSSAQQWLDQVGGVLETLNQGVIINDQAKHVVFANSMFLEMIKLPAAELLGRSIVDFYPPEDVIKLLEFIGRREAQGRARYEFYIPQADGGRLPVAVTSRLVQGGDGRAYGIVTATDISDQKRIQIELSQANALLLDRQRQVEQELQLAERVQQSLAPKSLTWRQVSVEAYYQPVWSIGGDYGLVKPRDDRLDVLVCDVSGHGISSALIANRIYSETIAEIERGADLGSMLRHLNHFAVQHLASSATYFTVAALRLDGAGRSLQFAGAGHPPGMIIRRERPPRLLESTSMVLGLFEDAVDSKSSIEATLQTGDRIVVYTDGLTENFNARREMLGIDGLREIVTDTSTLPLAEMKLQILNRVAAWRDGPAADDVSLVLLEIL
ncbi:MAG TPA: SpoIIE family protein phosphatase [Candidatus Acidoferrum sp.]|nr:SpoIIE family protein phosphatase [Candidatus Acidoferrum sp.]